MNTLETANVPTLGANVWPLSVAAYHALGEAGLVPEQTELIHGFVCHKMPKSPFHGFLVGRLLRLIQAVLPHRYLLRIEQPITGADSEPEPDIAVVLGVETDFAAEHPRTAEFVIEVCVSSHEYDRAKLRAYAEAGVKECWLILVPEKQIEAHRHPVDGQFSESSLHGPGGRLASESVPELDLDLTGFFSVAKPPSA